MKKEKLIKMIEQLPDGCEIGFSKYVSDEYDDKVILFNNFGIDTYDNIKDDVIVETYGEKVCDYYLVDYSDEDKSDCEEININDEYNINYNNLYLNDLKSKYCDATIQLLNSKTQQVVEEYKDIDFDIVKIGNEITLKVKTK